MHFLMPAPGDFKIEVNGFPHVLASIAGIAVKADRWGKETAERASRVGMNAMQRSAPDGDEFDLPALSSEAAQRGVTRKTPPRTRPKLKNRMKAFPPTWHPGGAGGGGYWEARFGVAGVGIRPLSHDPAFIVAHGSGIRGDQYASHHRITASTPGNVLTFMHQGRQVFAQSVGGQRPQHRWIDAGRNAAKAEIRRRIVELDVRLR